MAQRTIAAFFQSRPPPREALGDATNATAPVATSDESIFTRCKNDDAARTTTPPPKRARVAAPLPFAKGADVMDVRGVSSRAFGAQFCAVDGREILLCGHAWAAEDFTRPKHVRWLEPDDRAPSAPRDDDVSSAPAPARSSDDDVSRVDDVVIRGTDGLVARADGAVIRVYDAGAPTGAAPLASLCLAHDDVSSDANACECTRRATFLDAGAVTRMTSYSAGARESDDCKQMPRANLAATTAGGELAAPPRAASAAAAETRTRRHHASRARVAHGRHVPARVPGHEWVGEPARPVLHVARARANERNSRERTNESRDRAFRRGGGGDGRVVFRHAPPRRRGGGIRRRRQAGPRREPAPALSFPRDGREPRRARALGDPRRRDVDAETAEWYGVAAFPKPKSRR